jgi:hypothetical protein
MTSKSDKAVSAIAAAKDAGLSTAAIKTALFGRSKTATKERDAELRDMLASLTREGAIRGPFKHGRTQYYFATGRGPSIETASDVVTRLVLRSGVKLVSRPGLAKKVTGMNKPFFPDGLKHAVASRAIVELSCGSSKYYLHREVAAEYFDFETSPAGDTLAPVAPPAPEPPMPEADMTFAELLPAYRRLKAEQGGFSAVKIFDLMKALDRPKEVLHRLLVAEAKAGRISIHHTTSVELPAEVIDAGIRLPGYAEPFVTIVVKDEP